MDFIPCQPSSLSFFKPYSAASRTAGMCWRASGSFGLMVWPARSTLSSSEHWPWSSRGRRQARFSTTSQIPMVPTSMRTKSCPVWGLIPQLTGRYLHLQSSTSQLPAEIFTSLTLDFLFWVQLSEFSPSTHDTEVALDWTSQADPVYIKPF